MGDIVDGWQLSQRWLHGLIGSTVLFLTLHPLRDALDAQALELVRVGSALQAIQGLAPLALAQIAGNCWRL